MEEGNPNEDIDGADEKHWGPTAYLNRNRSKTYSCECSPSS
jgi:hypothetical protein